MPSLAIAPILKAMKSALAQPTEANIFALADAANLTIKKESLKIEVVEHTTKKGKVIKGVVRTDLSYAEAKAIDEYTFKKDGGWFIREKHLGVDIQAIDNQTTSTPQNEPETVLQSDTLVNDEDNNIKGLERKFKPASKKYKNPEINLEPKESAKLLKKTLTKLFPDTKFSVSMSRGTAYGSVSVSWVDGASYDLVNVIAQHFRGKGFDGSSDSTHYLNAINEDGKIVSYGLGYVSISRTYSREFLEKLQSSFSDMLQNMIKQEGATIKGSGDSAYFDAKENWTRDKINLAKSSHSTHKYNLGNAPQAANDEPVTADTSEAKPVEQPTSKLPVGWIGMLNGLATKEGDDGGIVDKQYGATNEWFVIPHNKLLWPIFEGKTFTSQKDAFVAFDKATNDLKLDESKIDEKAEILEKYGFITEVHGKWKYTTQNGVYPKFTANSKESAIESAWPYYLKVPKDELTTKAEKYEDSIQSFNQDMQKRYGSLSNDEISQKIDEISAEIKSLQAAGGREFTGNGTRRTSAATSNEAARQLGEEKMRLESYLKYREKLSQNNQPNLMQDATGLDPAIKDMVKEYYDLVNGTYVDEKLADPTLENWERKEYQQVKDDNIKRKDELAKHLNNVVSANGIDWKTYYNELVQTNKQEANNVPSTSNAMESDSDNAIGANQQQSVENGNDDESAELGRMARPSINGLDARGGSERDSSVSLSENDGIGIGTRGDTVVSDGAKQRGATTSNTASKSSRSSSTNEPRTPNERSRDSAIVRTSTRTGSVTQNEKEAAQLKADGTPTQWGDTANIDKALPYLLPEQRDDVAKLEKRLIEDNKNGMLFTNGTGTGKTFTGLGAVKRFANAGKKNILIVSMNDKIIRDFVKSALSLNLDIHQLDGVTDNGKDKIVATTYANLAQNLMLGKRDWDLIVVDEAHNLMQGEKGENTNALAKLRALSGHHAGFSEWVKMRHAEKDPKPIGENPETGNPIYNQDEVSAWEQFKKPLREQWQKTWAEQPKGRTKVIFLTATPFSYVKTLDWAEGYLFDFTPPEKKFSNDTEAMGAAYNSGSEYERFYMDNFGYKMRTNRLTRPNDKVDVGILERKFAEKLKTEGAMSGRDLSVPFDYDRKFVLVNSEIGKEIDEGFSYLWDTKDKDGKSKYSDLLRVLNKRFDYLARLQLLEAIKAQEAIEQIKKHIALGRKVIVFHDYNEGGGSNPFVYVGGATQNDVGAVESQYEDFKRARPDLIALDLDLDAPITTIKKAFPDALLYNGRVAKGQRSKNADLFNSDNNGHNVLIAQSDAGATGISFHDTTGSHQRVIINIGMPSKPAKLRQTEGRIYRVGQASNAIQRYLTTGTDWERSTFSQKIAERAETVDNLAQGESAVVSIKDALVQAYEEAEYFEPSENDGIGGKAYDEENARINKLTPFERAKTDYWVKQKVTAKRQDREGKEWYATPEPVGLFMVNLAGAHSGDDILEPSAGDGAIGRYMPSDASVTFIEPSESLASRARMNNTNANVIVDGFESHGANNKYDAIVMNPPFGQGGSIAIKHLVKAFEHLRDGGRVVALLPVGKMDELIVKYHEMGYFKDIYTVAEFALPSSTFKNAGTAVNTKIHVFERHNFKGDAPKGVTVKNLSHYDDIEDLFNAIENISIKPRKLRVDEALAEYGLEIYPDRSKYIITGEGIKRKDITSTLFGSYIEKNKDGDVVDKYNRSTAFLKWLKDSQIPTMAQFNNGLSFNNLPIKYQQNTNKYNTWDGVGGMPDWLSTAINRYGAKLENFAVEKPVYDAVDDNKPQAILSAMRQALDTPSEENIQALAREAGLRIKPVITNGFVKKGASRYEYIIWGVPKDGSLEELLFTQNQQGEVIATIEKAKDIKALLEDKYGVTKARIQEVDLGGGFDFSKEIAVKSVPPAVAETSVVPTSETSTLNHPQTGNSVAQSDKAAKNYSDKDKATDASDKKNIAQPQNTASQTKTTKKYKSGTTEWKMFCRDASIKYARLYQSYMNNKLDYDNFIKKKESSPLSDDSIKNIERVVSRNFYKWREIDILQYGLKPEYLNTTNTYDDIGSFNFTPAIDFDTTLKAIKTALTDSSEGNIKRLAMLTGLTLKQAEPDIELDMFGDPIQSQGFDLFGEPIQDGDDSPVEELPRLAVVELPLNKLKLSEDVPQFKSGVEDSETGVVEALGGKFDRTGVAPIQVWERTDGRLEIISGRHRTDLARRSGEKTIPAQVHKESEGFTAKQAMMLDAELNIRDGQGKVKDYVDYFTHSEISEDEADKRGLLARHIGQRAFTIASKGSEELKTLHRNEIISDQAAAEIANIAPNNSAMQAVGLRVLQEHKPLNNALNTIRAVMALTREKGQEPDTFDLFGFDDSALKEAEAMARIASRKQRQIAEQLNAIKGAVKNPKLAAKHGVVVENEADALAKVQSMTAQKARWDNWSSHADLLAEVRNELNNKLDSVFDEDDYYWLCQEELVA